MLSIKQVTRARNNFLSPFSLLNNALISASSSASSQSSLDYTAITSIKSPTVFLCPRCRSYNSDAHGFQAINTAVTSKDIALAFEEWFKSRKRDFHDRVFEILSRHDEVDEQGLLQLGLQHQLSEAFVLDLLSYGSTVKKDVLSCIKFFDWAGRQNGFVHTRATFHRMFKILSVAKHVQVMVNILDEFMNRRMQYQYYHVKQGFYATVVMGYAMAGKPLVALQLLGKMRFQGIDLDSFVYHVLLNSLVEENRFDAVDEIAKQISARGFEIDITHCIMVKSLCKQKLLDEAEAYLRRVILHKDGRARGHDKAVSFLVDALCRNRRFDKAGEILEEFRASDVVPMKSAYSMWLRNLVRAGQLDAALEFLQSKKSSAGYIPEIFRLNILLNRLLRKNRLKEAFDMLIEMNEAQISPDEVTMNTALCLLCKAGMLDVALYLYASKAEFGLTPNTLAYNYLINSLCGDGGIDEACNVLSNATERGYFPGKKTFSIILNALCREGKLDKMRELVDVAIKRHCMPRDDIYDKYVLALCMANRAEDAYLMYEDLDRMNIVPKESMYTNLIRGFNKLNRGAIAAEILTEMQDKGYKATERLLRIVIHGLCKEENSEMRIFRLLEMLQSQHEANCHIYNLFIREAGAAKKPELARGVFEMMQRDGFEPNHSSYILMLQSYIKRERISDALKFFNDVCRRGKGSRKFYNVMVVGLSKVNRADLALSCLGEMRGNGLVPSLQCYEILVKLLCSIKYYDVAVNLIIDLHKVGRHISSFLGNTLLLHAVRNDGLYEVWLRVMRKSDTEISSDLAILGRLIGAFSDHIMVSQEIGNLEEVIQQCFPLDIVTYNVMLMKLSMRDMDQACQLFYRIRLRGYEPNQWTYKILARGYMNRGLIAEAESWLEEMYRKGLGTM